MIEYASSLLYTTAVTSSGITTSIQNESLNTTRGVSLHTEATAVGTEWRSLTSYESSSDNASTFYSYTSYATLLSASLWSIEESHQTEYGTDWASDSVPTFEKTWSTVTTSSLSTDPWYKSTWASTVLSTTSSETSISYSESVSYTSSITRATGSDGNTASTLSVNAVSEHVFTGRSQTVYTSYTSRTSKGTSGNDSIMFTLTNGLKESITYYTTRRSGTDYFISSYSSSSFSDNTLFLMWTTDSIGTQWYYTYDASPVIGNNALFTSSTATSVTSTQIAVRMNNGVYTTQSVRYTHLTTGSSYTSYFYLTNTTYQSALTGTYTVTSTYSTTDVYTRYDERTSSNYVTRDKHVTAPGLFISTSSWESTVKADGRTGFISSFETSASNITVTSSLYVSSSWYVNKDYLESHLASFWSLMSTSVKSVDELQNQLTSLSSATSDISARLTDYITSNDERISTITSRAAFKTYVDSVSSEITSWVSSEVANLTIFEPHFSSIESSISSIESSIATISSSLSNAVSSLQSDTASITQATHDFSTNVASNITSIRNDIDMLSASKADKTYADAIAQSLESTYNALYSMYNDVGSTSTFISSYVSSFFEANHERESRTVNWTMEITQ